MRSVPLPADLRDQAIQHEVLHTIGLGHTCRFPSVMYSMVASRETESCVDSSPPSRYVSRRVTAQDQWAVRLWRGLFEASVQRPIDLGTLNALRGYFELSQGQATPPWLEEALSDASPSVNGAQLCRGESVHQVRGQ